MTSPADVTLAEETLTAAMLSAIIACTAVNYIIITQFNITSITGYIVLTIASFVTFGYLVPNLTALWLGRSIDEIYSRETTVEDTID